MVEKVKLPETQEAQQPTTPTDKTPTPTTQDHEKDVGQKFLQDLGEQYLGPNKPDATKVKDVADQAKPENEQKKHEDTALTPEIRKKEEPSQLEFTNLSAYDNATGLRDIEDRVKTPEEIQQEDEDWERRRIPEIEERSKDIKGMKDLKLEPTAKSDINPTPSKTEIEIMGVKPEDAAKVNAEVNKNGMTPEKALTDAMKSARVVGIDNPQIDWKQNLDFSMKAFKALKDGGATHAVFDVPTSMKPLLDEFNKTGVVDRTKLNMNAKTDYDAASMQAALNNGLKIVSGGTEAFLDNSKSDQRAKAIHDILDGDKDAKVVLVSSGEHLADGSDRHGHPSTVQRLIDAGVPVKTAKVTDPDSYDEKTAVLGQELKSPVAIPTDKSPAIAALKVGFLGEQKMGSWDLNIIMPDVKKN